MPRKKAGPTPDPELNRIIDRANAAKQAAAKSTRELHELVRQLDEVQARVKASVTKDPLRREGDRGGGVTRP